MKRFVIYTSLTAGYDRLPEYGHVDPDFDYICYTNDYPENCRIGFWTIKKIPYSSEDNTRLSRYVKMNPHKVLGEYEYSVWIDSNILLNGPEPYVIFKKMIGGGVLWGAVPHPQVDCIYKDADLCVKLLRDKYSEIKRQVEFLRSEGYPKNNGLYENNVIIRDHRNTAIQQICEEWWKIYCTYTKRDQLSLCYIFWKFNFTPEDIYPKGVSTFNAPGIQRLHHNKKSIPGRIAVRIKRLAMNIRLRLQPL